MKFVKCNTWEERYNIIHNNEWIGYFVFQDDERIHIINLYPDYRGKGLLRMVYADIEQQWKVTLKPSACIINPVMLKYWKKRNADLSKTKVILK